MQGLKLCIDRIFPARKDSPIEFKLPKIKSPEDVPKVTEALLKAVASGELTPSEAESVSKVLERHIKAVEVSELAAELEKLKIELGVQ